MRINPRNIEVIGYESPACLEMLISLMFGKIKKDVIPPVKLYTFDDGKSYEVPYPGADNLAYQDGGHHRLLASYLLDEKCDIEVVESTERILHKIEIPIYERIPISQIEIESDVGKFHYEKNIPSKNYRELPSVEDFFDLYSKINFCLKYSTHTNYSLNKSSYEKIFDDLKTLEKRVA